ncbi:MAG: hypothetical protein ACR2H2_08745 [Solirubrobacteraceae bacterium]
MLPAPLTRAAGPRPSLVLPALAAAAALAGTLAAVAPPKLVLAAALALAVVLAVALHPPVAAYLLLATTPLLAGLDRGLVLPLLRPHEAVAVLVATGLVAHLVLRAAAREPALLRLSFGRVDVAILVLALTGSVLPLLDMALRGRAIVQDDLLYALQVWKYYAVFVIVRSCIRTPAQVRRCLWLALLAAAVVALVAIAQVVGAPGIGSITRHYEPEAVNRPQLERGTSTLASSIAVGDVMVFSLAIAAGLLLRGDRRQLLLGALGLLLVFGTVATGQFSAIIAMVVGLLAFGWLTGRLSRSILTLTPVAGVAALLLRPVIEARLSGFHGGKTLPASWQVRLDNVTTHFWPVLQGDLNWLTGVRPLARIAGPRFSGIDFIWIESGYVWLLWTGGVAFALAFAWYAAVALRTVARIARRRADAVGIAATASFTALVVTVVLMALDPHVTLRGSADLSFALLALALTGSRAAPAGEP